MQSPYIPETPGRSPVVPEEKPASPQPEAPGVGPEGDEPQEAPAHPDDPEGEGRPVTETPEALAVRIP